KDFRFHDLRHTAATRMADYGADAFTLAAIFGWSDVRMALRYTHATDEAKRRAVENLVRPVASSDESVTNEKGRVAALPQVIDLIRGAEGDRTPDIRIANAALCQTELLPHAKTDTTFSSFDFQV